MKDALCKRSVLMEEMKEMKDCKRLIAGFNVTGQQVSSCGGHPLKGSLASLGAEACRRGADQIWVRDGSQDDEEHENVIGQIKELAKEADEPIFAGGRIKRLEDVKKYLYAGASAVFLDAAIPENVDLISEAAGRFGPEKIYVMVPDENWVRRAPEYARLGASGIMVPWEGSEKSGKEEHLLEEIRKLPPEGEQPFNWILLSLGLKPAGTPALAAALKEPEISAVVLNPANLDTEDFMELKQHLKSCGIPVDTFESSLEWADFKTNSNGLVPVIVQDYKTGQVLMMAYMNEQAFEDTLRTGRMHYYSRSRKSQWLKGETSGHFQYVKSLKIDCDRDTILAVVHQIGPACHTGNTSCFFTTLAEKDYRQTNPLKVFEDVYQVILDRKEHPKEGSYTNYLFDKGIDKILKKVGEEATEIVIAAKNPNPEEVKYEIADFLYHMMVLMAQKGISWEEITKELADR